ncbi:MAG: ParA family protein [Desulfobacteraceae bacterium]|nr:MAG: ParA family protein [Desulfobacteraceae bacterium]
MCKIITITGQKGGSGKSTVAVNLSACLALFEKKTLLIDCDPQASSTSWSGIKDSASKYSLPDVLAAKCSIEQAVQPTQLNYLEVIPSEFSLMIWAAKLSAMPENQKILKLLLDEIREAYEFIIIDSPSSYHFLSLAALTASQSLIITLSPDAEPEKEFSLMARAMKYIRNNHQIKLTIARIIGNRFDSRDHMINAWESDFSYRLKDLSFKLTIPDDRTIDQARKNGMPVVLHDFKSPSARAYLSVARELTAL